VDGEAVWAGKDGKSDFDKLVTGDGACAPFETRRKSR
jgi:hypothetical protein